MNAMRTRSLTSPWRGEVAERSEAGGGESRSDIFTPPRRGFAAPTLPLQGRVSERSRTRRA
jgi:hypothetical protein